MKNYFPASTADGLRNLRLTLEPETIVCMETFESGELIDGKKTLSLSLFDQLRAGIDNIVSDGGTNAHQHFVTTFIGHLSGVDFAKRRSCQNPYPAMMQASRPSWGPSSGKKPFC